MGTKVLTGLARLRSSAEIQGRFTGNIGLVCNSASVDSDFKHSVEIFKNVYGDRFKKIFGPQHGFVTDVQDNMIETDHFTHPYFELPVYSLYSETRIPTDEMLEGIDHLFIDLQEVGCRIYTYMYTMTLILEKCANNGIEVVILDRPNPINAETIEGNILDLKHQSFVGRHPIPVRHGLTIGEIAKMHQTYWTDKKCKYQVIPMEHYQRSLDWSETGLPYLNPSPNLATTDSCYTFPGTVLFEGCSMSEGRGSTRALEQVGHPQFEPWAHLEHFQKLFKSLDLSGFELRPVHFYPMFQKHEHQSCGGYFIHVTDKSQFKPWRVGQILFKEFRHLLKDHFHYKTDGYEYEFNVNAMNLINGDERFLAWYDDKNTSYDFLDLIESERMSDFLEKRQACLLY